MKVRRAGRAASSGRLKTPTLPETDLIRFIVVALVAGALAGLALWIF